MEHPPEGLDFGRYTLLERIATGGMAEIFRARMTAMAGVTKPVVIKKILPGFADKSAFVSMFVNEARIAAGLSHGNIAQVFDFGEVAGQYFIAMEWVDGHPLSRVLRRAREKGHYTLPQPLALLMTAEVLKGLAYAHTRLDDRGRPLHIIHRDVSPQNVLLSFEGQVKLVDFGIARARLAGGLMSDEPDGMGKYAYFAPEQARGRELDARADIFAAGTLLYETLCGRRPFEGDAADVMRKIALGDFPRPRELSPDIPSALERILLTALAVEREQRYASAELFAESLTRYLNTTTPDISPSALAHFMGYLFEAELVADGRPVLLPREFLSQLARWTRTSSERRVFHAPVPDGSRGDRITEPVPAPDAHRIDALSDVLSSPGAETASSSRGHKERTTQPIPAVPDSDTAAEAPRTDVESSPEQQPRSTSLTEAAPPTPSAPSLSRSTLSTEGALPTALSASHPHSPPPTGEPPLTASEPSRPSPFLSPPTGVPPPAAHPSTGLPSPTALVPPPPDLAPTQAPPSRLGFRLAALGAPVLAALGAVLVVMVLGRNGTFSVELSSSPPGASIRVDGRPLDSVTPALLTHLPADGEHLLEIQIPGMVPWSQVVRAERGSTLAVHARLRPRINTSSASGTASAKAANTPPLQDTNWAPGGFRISAVSHSFRVPVSSAARVPLDPARTYLVHTEGRMSLGGPMSVEHAGYFLEGDKNLPAHESFGVLGPEEQLIRHASSLFVFVLDAHREDNRGGLQVHLRELGGPSYPPFRLDARHHAVKLARSDRFVVHALDPGTTYDVVLRYTAEPARTRGLGGGPVGRVLGLVGTDPGPEGSPSGLALLEVGQPSRLRGASWLQLSFPDDHLADNTGTLLVDIVPVVRPSEAGMPAAGHRHGRPTP
ncbi:serine/threonine-protein kinase [Myxococcus landrumensis]|uniref:non-specific serine/threonine protein kinase n=1 Tax=Myxococcus landrumensis TaxID=2813577 RepID=A0ABX7N7M7_9BACT|nr:serine/threonine-protein kinase [Myxococcus landrumus]QSQ13672.1 protein kinase [Myxococcus landrumus]